MSTFCFIVLFFIIIIVIVISFFQQRKLLRLDLVSFACHAKQREAKMVDANAASSCARSEAK